MIWSAIKNLTFINLLSNHFNMLGTVESYYTCHQSESLFPCVTGIAILNHIQLNKIACILHKAQPSSHPRCIYSRSLVGSNP